MPTHQSLRFGAFEIDLRDERLWLNGAYVHLTNRAFSVLRFLVEHPDRLVSKETLLEALWPRDYVTDAALAVCVREIRQALGDNARSPLFIQTVRGRGYRFIAPIHAGVSNPAENSYTVGGYTQSNDSPIVGRVEELTKLHQWFTQMLEGERRVIFVCGEVGIGKSTLIDEFVTQVSHTEDLLVGRGQCIEQYGSGEAYLPVLEALSRLCSSDYRKRLIEHLRRYAPSWLSQLPALVSDSELQILQRTGSGLPRHRMIRELAECIEEVSAELPILLIFEDLHWSDTGTLEWLSYITRRRGDAKLMILASYRPVDVIVAQHPLRAVVQELKVQPHCRELIVDYLTRTSIDDYLKTRLSARRVPGKFIEAIHRRCSGNPLFLVTLVDMLQQQGVLSLTNASPRLLDNLNAPGTTVPESLRQLIDWQLDNVDHSSQGYLEVASVVGVQFSLAAVAAGASTDIEAVEGNFAVLVKHGQFVRFTKDDNTSVDELGGDYEFIHALYQEVLYSRIPSARRARLHRLIGENLEKEHYQERNAAAELAVHFVRGAEPLKAIRYMNSAGVNAVLQSAYPQAESLFTGGLELVSRLEHNAECAHLELSLQHNLAGTLIATKGYAWPAVEKALSRAHELCKYLGETDQASTVFYGLCLFHLDRGEMKKALEVATESMTAAESADGTAAYLLAHRLLGTCYYFLGEFESARDHLEQALDYYNAPEHADLVFVCATDVRVTILCWLSRTLYILGHESEAQITQEKALKCANEISHAHSIVFAMRDACFLPLMNENAVEVRRQALMTIAFARSHGFKYELEECRILLGWASSRLGRPQLGIRRIRFGVTHYRKMGSQFQVNYFTGLLADAERTAGHNDLGHELINQALENVHLTREKWFEAELHRLRGELYSAEPPVSIKEAEAEFRQAQRIARAQSATKLEQKASESLARNLRRHSTVENNDSGDY